ncbi:MAG: Holliday junction DNA helicase RuvA [Armatimonadetes bacterium 55-13]|nr:Holliday junction branch migration protein RuvA [Armatimonadota bacterium]OJU64617.1 MAG: Holliday junction DNA helicase RuvA [Armatimonadetes bacterium 55-13]
MIGRLRGELVETEGSLVLVDCAGVGYEVLVPDSVLMQMPAKGDEVTLLIRQIFREDGVSLYGFLEVFQRRLFDLLMTVKGCGPKVGLSLIGMVGEDAVAGAILSQDAKVLTRASGVGARLAERIILELKEKIGEEQFQRKVTAAASVTAKQAPADELVDALLALGYRRNEAESAAEKAREEADAVEDQLRHALRLLKK